MSTAIFTTVTVIIIVIFFIVIVIVIVILVSILAGAVVARQHIVPAGATTTGVFWPSFGAPGSRVGNRGLKGFKHCLGHPDSQRRHTHAQSQVLSFALHHTQLAQSPHGHLACGYHLSVRAGPKQAVTVTVVAVAVAVAAEKGGVRGAWSGQQECGGNRARPAARKWSALATVMPPKVGVGAICSKPSAGPGPVPVAVLV